MRYRLLFIFLFVFACGLNAQTFHPENSVLSSGNWYAVSIPSSGVYKLTRADFVALGVAEEEINFDNLSIFGRGGKAIREINAENEYSDLREKAIYVNNGSNPYVLFYANGTMSVDFDSQNKSFDFEVHPYSDQTTYFITFDPQIGEKKRITARQGFESENAIEKSTERDVFIHKRELMNFNSSGRRWAGEAFSTITTEVSVPMFLQNVNISEPIELKLSLFNQSETPSKFHISLNNNSVGTINALKTPQDYAAYNAVSNFVCNVSGDNNSLKINYEGQERGRLDYVKAQYIKNLRYNNSSLTFYTTFATDSEVEYAISNVKNDAFKIWIVDGEDVSLVSDYEKNAEEVRFALSQGGLRRIIMFSGSNFPTPALKGKIENQNLHSWPATDFVIVTAPQFLAKAEELAELHRQHDGISVQVATTTQVYNEFSSGTKDFLAIRELMRMLYDRYSSENKAPSNLLLFGDGTFDNKNILKYNNNFIPTYQSESSLIDAGSSYTTDDVLTYLSPYAKGRIIDTMLVGVGRFTVNTVEEAENMVDKCKRYMQKQDLREGVWGDWRNVVTLTADDADTWGERYFIDNAETIYYEIKETNPNLNVEKIYSDAYKQYSSSSGATYPDASKAINQRMKKGSLLLNYVGHGSDDHLSSERLITITDITGWDNKNALPIVITSTCEFTRFDRADKQSAGEFVLSSANGGGIALISASRKIPSRNEINKNLHRFAVVKENGRGLTFGEVFRRAKNATSLVVEERSFGLFGDPALRIDLPRYEVITTKINGKAVGDSIIEDTIKALSTMSVEGEIVDENGTRLDDFDGKIMITLLDKLSIYRTLDNEGLDTDIEFEQQKNILHKGIAKVIGGRFEYTFTLPKDIAYNYGKGKISYYAQNDSIDAAGNFTEFIVGGIDTSVVVVETRPDIRLYMNDTNFRNGGLTDENPHLFAIVSDSIAINTVGTGLGHDIVARLDNAANTFILNDYFEVDSENPNAGTIRYPFTDLSEGEHTLTLKVWNIFNFSNEKEIKFVVKSSKRGEEFRLKNYPNPFTSFTNIVLEHNQSDAILFAELIIFNQNGKMILKQDITPYVGTYTVGPIQWDGTTEGGERLQNGLYFARMRLRTSTDEFMSETIKMSVFNNRK